MDAERLADLLLAANRLKNTPRTGWVVRGVPRPESVADHAWGVSLTALLLADLVDEDVDREKVLTMAVLHDLPEAVTGDLSLGASRLLPAGAKAAAEGAALDELGAGVGAFDRWRAVWDEFEAEESLEARLVRDADRLDLLTQALVYEQTTGNRGLGEFWEFAPPGSFRLEVSRDLARVLTNKREG